MNPHEIARAIEAQRDMIWELARQGERATLRKYARRNPGIAEDVARALAGVPRERGSVALLEFDGACEPVNPGGVISWGWLLRGTGGKVFDSDCGVDDWRGPDNTNNVAEYKALIAGLEAASEGQVRELHVLGDSKLVIKQMQGEWGCKSERLRPLYDRGWELQEEFERIWFAWIPRERNTEADELTQRAYAEDEMTDRTERRPWQPGKAPVSNLGATEC